MATDITLKSYGLVETLTVVDPRKALGQAYVQDQEKDNEVVSGITDLADNRSLNLELFAQPVADRGAGLEVTVETSSDNFVSDSRTIASFERMGVDHLPNYLQTQAMREGKQRITVQADRYVRVRARVVKLGSDSLKRGINFSVTGRAVGSAT